MLMKLLLAKLHCYWHNLSQNCKKMPLPMQIMLIKVVKHWLHWEMLSNFYWHNCLTIGITLVKITEKCSASAVNCVYKTFIGKNSIVIGITSVKIVRKLPLLMQIMLIKVVKHWPQWEMLSNFYWRNWIIIGKTSIKITEKYVPSCVNYTSKVL
jgi:hypothetical protein